MQEPDHSLKCPDPALTWLAVGRLCGSHCSMSFMSARPSSEAAGRSLARLVGTRVGNLNLRVAASFMPSAQECCREGKGGGGEGVL